MVLSLLGCGGSDSPVEPQPTGPMLSINNVAVNEGSNAVLIVSLSETVGQAVTFTYSTSPGSATAADYTVQTNVSGSIASGATTTTITIVTIDDVTAETSEAFSVVLSSPTNAGISDGTGSVTINANDGGAAGVSFMNDVRPIITSSCAIAACHGDGSNQGSLTFGSATYPEVRNANGGSGPIVIVGNAASSNLYLKVTPTPPFGSRMPVGGPFLSATQINLIRDWINQGALNN